MPNITNISDLMNRLPASLTLGGEYLPLNCLDCSAYARAANGIRADITQQGLRSNNYVYRRFSLTNQSGKPSGRITLPLVLDAAIPALSARLHTLTGDDCSKHSFTPVDRDFADGDSLTLTPTGGRSSNTTAFTFMDFDFGGAALLLAVGWSGQWRCDISLGEGKLRIKLGLCDADFFLYPGERVDLPSVFLVMGADGADVRRRARRIMFEDFGPLAGTGTTLPISIQPYDRYFYGRCPRWPTEEGQLETLRNALRCRHFNTHWIDAAWFRRGFPHGVGNYSFAGGFPNGLRPVADAVHEAGLRFMVWFEPERVYSESEVWVDHPEFFLRRPGDENTGLYNLGDEAAYVWLRDTLINFIRDNGIDNYRQDFNMDPLDYWRQNDAEGRKGISEIKHINGLYRLWDDLRAAFPALLIDDCSSGGRRIDFETMRRSVPMWRSDTACGPITPEKHNDVNGQNQTLALGEYLPYHAAAAWEPVPNDIRSAATEGLACTFDILNPGFDFDTAEKLLAEVTENAPLWRGDFYPLTPPTLAEDGFAAWQLQKGDEGFASVFRRAECERDTFNLKLKGLDPDAEYILLITDEKLDTRHITLTGKALAEGYPLIIPNPRASAMVRISRRLGGADK